MAIRARFEGGKFAIYTVPTLTSTDNAPLTDPNNNTARTKWHSDHEYTGIKSETSGTLTLPARSGDTPVRVDHQLFAHGQPSAPMVFGKLTGIYTNEGGPYTLPILSSTAIPIPVGSGKYANNSDLHRYVSITVDDTYVYLREYGMVMGSGWSDPDGAYIACRYGYRASSSSPMNGDSGMNISDWPSQTVNWTVAVTQYLVTGPVSGVDAALPVMKMTGASVQFGRGKFNSQNGYLYKTTSNDSYVIPGEKHMRAVTGGEQIIANQVVVSGVQHRFVAPPNTVAVVANSAQFTVAQEKLIK